MRVAVFLCLVSMSVSLQLTRFMNMKLNVGSGKVLIVQNKGGGHGEIGYQLCKTIKAEAPNCELFVLQDEYVECLLKYYHSFEELFDNDHYNLQNRCNYKKPPFSSYAKDLVEGLGVKVINEKLTGAESISGLAASGVKGMKFDYIGKPKA